LGNAAQSYNGDATVAGRSPRKLFIKIKIISLNNRQKEA